ncbi:hypothetical protein JMA_24710 [Jeotgalibacillus malaysiensis]|uniref:Uncharacterized protein n=1 Tax=Jeotgalibacillus malaysiensis TaxID=1508404 RepID=A0A0B5AT91_9BACL|nr:hypothetical protein JMA_24710 [Jeotgalibacillus malaysiensis]
MEGAILCTSHHFRTSGVSVTTSGVLFRNPEMPAKGISRRALAFPSDAAPERIREMNFSASPLFSNTPPTMNNSPIVSIPWFEKPASPSSGEMKPNTMNTKSVVSNSSSGRTTSITRQISISPTIPKTNPISIVIYISAPFTY